MQAWQYGAKEDLLLASPAAPAQGTLAADIPIYLATLPEGSYRDDSEDILAHWIACPLGAQPRHTITRLEVIAQISRWLDAGAAVATCNRRLSRLRKLYHALDGVTTLNPTVAIKFQREPEREPRDLPMSVVQLIVDALPDQGRAERGGTRPTTSETKIRLRVMAWTGIAPATLRRVRPRDLDLDGARIYLRPRRKGQGSDGAWVALLPTAVEAFRAFAAANLFGRAWSRSSMRKTWHVGIARAKAAAARDAERTGDRTWVTALAHLPPRCKPYDLRHSFASEMYRITGDIRAVSELLQHADLETTKRYTKGAVSERVTAAIATAAAAFAAPPPPARPRRGALRLVGRHAPS
jgi:integrase